jgi:hypothetical protein
MKKVLLVLFLGILFASCEKRNVAEITQKTDDGNYIIFEGKKCPVISIIYDDKGIGTLIEKATGKVIKDITVIKTEGVNPSIKVIQESKIMSLGISCYCECCSIGFSQRWVSGQYGTCIECPGCHTGQLTNPFYYFTCSCGNCSMFWIED